jgi:epoxyqueuosine reductase
LRDAIPLEFKNKMTEWAFGCDICQDVCPWNRFSKPHQESRFEASDDFLGMKKNDWVEMTEEVFTQRFKKSPLSRAGYLGLIKNVRFLDSD